MEKALCGEMLRSLKRALLTGDVIVAWTLYVLLAQVSRTLSLLTAWCQLVPGFPGGGWENWQAW